jgi:hypothetical protein
MANRTTFTRASATGNLQSLVTNYNANLDALEVELENSLSRKDNILPNSMEDELDMNGNDIINVNEIDVLNLTINGTPVEPFAGVTVASAFQSYTFTATLGQTSFSIAPFTAYVTSVQVEVNGLSLPPADISVSGTNVIIPACTAGDEVVIRRYTKEPSPFPAADDITFNQAGTVTTRTVQNKLRETVSVKDFGAVGDGVANDTAAVQAALDAAQTVFFPDGNYLVDTLYVRTFNNARLYGKATLYKRSNGTLLDNSMAGTTIDGLRFIGTDYAGVSKTGHNIVSSGSTISLYDVASISAAGRALWAKNGGTRVIGGGFSTSDATASGYDIELGDGGTTQSLYNFITAMSTSQPTGGIYANAAELRLTLCQIGKLKTSSGVLQAFGNRIIGDVEIGGSGSVITGNNFAGSAITFTVGTAGCSLFGNALATGLTITNSGNGNTFIESNVSTGSYPVLEYGNTSSGGKIAYNAENYFGFSRELRLSGAIKMYAGGVFEDATAYNLLSFTAGGGVFIGTDLSYVQHNAASAHQFLIGGSQIVAVAAGVFQPGTDNTVDLGSGSFRFKTVYAGTGTINTSDAREKQQGRSLSDAEKAVAVKVKGLLKAFKFNDAVAAKGDGARIHFGVYAQEVADAFASEGLDAHDYALFCYDEWDELPEITDTIPAEYDADGNMVKDAEIKIAQKHRPAGNRYGIRYEELLAFVLAAI